jgi:hypothetical protein
MANVRFALAAVVVACFAVAVFGHLFVRYEVRRIAKRDAKRAAASKGGDELSAHR